MSLLPQHLFRTGLLACLAMAIASCLFSPAQAHPRKEAFVEIVYNENTEKVEIIHRFRIPEAEAAIQQNYEAGLDLLTQDRAQAAFGMYVEERFTLMGNGRKIELELVAGEISEGSVWIYQETDPLPQDGLYLLRDTTLMDVARDQTNIVNIRLYDEVQSFVLNRTSPWVAFRLDGADIYPNN